MNIIPNYYQLFLSENNGWKNDENGTVLYSKSDIDERNRTFEVDIYLPEFLLIGDNSGGVGFFIKKNQDSSTFIYQCDLSDLNVSSMIVICDSLKKWTEMGASEKVVEVSNPLITVTLNTKPKRGIKALSVIQKELKTSLSASKIFDLLKSGPVTLLHDVYLSKYEASLKYLCKEIPELKVFDQKNRIFIY